MIVRVCVDQNASLHDLVAIIYPTGEFRSAVNDGLAPRHRQFLDFLAITKPTNVGPARRNRIECQLLLG